MKYLIGTRRGAAVLGMCVLAACGGTATQAPQEPDPSLEEPAGPVAAASSAKVSEGIEAIQAQEFERAKSVLTAARADAPKDPQAAFYLGVALQALGDTSGAAREFEAALALEPKLAEASVNLSAMWLDQEMPDKALPVIERGLAHAPKHPDLLVNRALALEAAGKTLEAVKAYGAAVQARPDDVELRLAYADMLLTTEQPGPALEQVKVAAQTGEPALLAAAAHLFGRLKAPAECVGALDRALAAKATAELHVRRGVCRHAAGDDSGAKADYDAALALDASFVPAHYYLGMHLRAKNKKAALEHLKKASELGKGQGLGKAADEALAELEPKKRK